MIIVLNTNTVKNFNTWSLRFKPGTNNIIVKINDNSGYCFTPNQIFLLKS